MSQWTGPGQTKGPDAQGVHWQAWIDSITGAAREAWGTGRVFHVVKLDCGGTVAGYMSQSSTGGDDVAGALQVIESVGWRLDSSGYVYQPLKERSHALTDSANLTGNIIGIFVFRRAGEIPPSPVS
jgi:hypothetical protein